MERKKADEGKARRNSVSEDKVKLSTKHVLYIYSLGIHVILQPRDRRAATPRRDIRRKEQKRKKNEQKMHRGRGRNLSP